MRRASQGSNKNRRPNSSRGRALKTWMLAHCGDGLTVPCAFCNKRLFFSEFTKDLYPIPARRGGRYVQGNVRPACLSCNARDGALQAARERAEMKQKREARNARRRERYALRKETQAA